jgi:hypothetical protein
MLALAAQTTLTWLDFLIIFFVVVLAIFVTNRGRL